MVNQSGLPGRQRASDSRSTSARDSEAFAHLASVVSTHVTPCGRRCLVDAEQVTCLGVGQTMRFGGVRHERSLPRQNGDTASDMATTHKYRCCEYLAPHGVGRRERTTRAATSPTSSAATGSTTRPTGTPATSTATTTASPASKQDTHDQAAGVEAAEGGGRDQPRGVCVRRTLVLLTILSIAGTGCAAAENAGQKNDGQAAESASGSPDRPDTPRDKAKDRPGPAKTTPTDGDDDPPKDEPAKPATPKPKPEPEPTRRVPAGVPTGAQAAIVDQIIDGDTLELHARRAGRVLSSTRLTGVRLLEIDTPETVHPSEPVQCYGPAASDALARLAPVGSTVWVLADQELKDYYDRTLLYLWADAGDESLFINRALVARGFAKASLYEPNDRFINVMYAAESAARSADRGLWGFCSRFGEPLAQPEPQPTPAPAPSGGGGNCDPSYSGACIPPYPPDLDCTEISAQGFNVVGDDPHGFDADGDGIACDT